MQANNTQASLGAKGEGRRRRRDRNIVKRYGVAYERGERCKKWVGRFERAQARLLHDALLKGGEAQ